MQRRADHGRGPQAAGGGIIRVHFRLPPRHEPLHLLGGDARQEAYQDEPVLVRAQDEPAQAGEDGHLGRQGGLGTPGANDQRLGGSKLPEPPDGAVRLIHMVQEREQEVHGPDVYPVRPPHVTLLRTARLRLGRWSRRGCRCPLRTPRSGCGRGARRARWSPRGRWSRRGRGSGLLGLHGGTRRALALLDEPLHLLSPLAANLLIEVRTPGRLHPISALLANLLIELGAPLGLHGLAALAANLLVERTAPLGLHGRAALAADRLVELAASLVANRLAPLTPRLSHGHAALVVLVLLHIGLLLRSPRPHEGAPCLKPWDGGAPMQASSVLPQPFTPLETPPKPQ